MDNTKDTPIETTVLEDMVAINQSLKLELQKQKELNAELVKRIEELTPRTSEEVC